MANRRTFIKKSGLVTAGLLMNQPLFTAGKKQKTGLQVYTLRKVMNSTNAPTIFSTIAAIGYKELEIFGYSGKDAFWGREPKALKALLKANGLTAPAAHIAFENFLTGKDENELRLICHAAGIVGNKFIVVAWLPEHFRRTAQDYQLIAARLNKAAIIAGQYGLQLAYHNHDFEFKKLEDDVCGYDIILKETDTNLVKMELDIYWAVKAGVEPVQLFTENPGRFPLWHIKDMDKLTGSFTEVGAGSIDFRSIFEQKEKAGMQHFFIEQDEVKKDVFESIRESYAYVQKNSSSW